MKMNVRPATIQRKPENEGKTRKKPVPAVCFGAIVNKVTKKTRYNKTDVVNVLRAALELITAETIKGHPVRLRGLGTLTVVDRAERKCRNPQTGEEMMSPAHKTIKIRPARGLMRTINK